MTTAANIFCSKKGNCDLTFIIEKVRNMFLTISFCSSMWLIFIDTVLTANEALSKVPKEENTFLFFLLFHPSFTEMPHAKTACWEMKTSFSSRSARKKKTILRRWICHFFLVCFSVSKQLHLTWEHSSDLFPQLNSRNEFEAVFLLAARCSSLVWWNLYCIICKIYVLCRGSCTAQETDSPSADAKC